MSKGIAKEVKLEVLKLYRDILKLHYIKKINKEAKSNMLKLKISWSAP
jgi:hypothetical protein